MDKIEVGDIIKYKEILGGMSKYGTGVVTSVRGKRVYATFGSIKFVGHHNEFDIVTKKNSPEKKKENESLWDDAAGESDD